jgi:hypothetical protein
LLVSFDRSSYSLFSVFAGIKIKCNRAAKNGRYPQRTGLRMAVMQAGSGFVDKKSMWIDWTQIIGPSRCAQGEHTEANIIILLVC